MRIAIEALGIHFYGGGRTATMNLLQALFALDTENEYLLFLNQPEPDLEAPHVRQYIAPVKNRFAMRVWAQVALPWLTRSCDVVHFVKNLGVFGLRVPFVVTVYDMTTLLYPELFPAFDVWYWRTIEKRTLWDAAKVIAISQQTARDIQDFYGLPPERIEVIYPACGRHFCPASPQDVARVRKVYQLPDEYVLHVGRIDLVGEQYKKKPDLSIYEKIGALGLQDVVQLLGAVPDQDLPAIYSGATVAALPSVHEGFGLVALEALSCGTPLVVNKAGAVTEVVGDAALVRWGRS